jgi:hypothetical protein
MTTRVIHRWRSGGDRGELEAVVSRGSLRGSRRGRGRVGEAEAQSKAARAGRPEDDFEEEEEGPAPEAPERVRDCPRARSHAGGRRGTVRTASGRRPRVGHRGAHAHGWRLTPLARDGGRRRGHDGLDARARALAARHGKAHRPQGSVSTSRVVAFGGPWLTADRRGRVHGARRVGRRQGHRGRARRGAHVVRRWPGDRINEAWVPATGTR